MKTEINACPAVRSVETPSEMEDAVGEKRLLLKIFMSNKKILFLLVFCIVPLYSLLKNV